MAKLKALDEEQKKIVRKADIDPEGYGLEYMDENKMILRHFRTGYEVWIRKVGMKHW